MVNLYKLESDKKEILKDLNPIEMKVYLNKLIVNLYEAFIEHDSDKGIATKELIEEAVKLFESEGYVNTLPIELSLRLEQANKCFIETLEAKEEQERELSKIILANNLGSINSDLDSSNIILNKLVESYVNDPQENLLAVTKDIVEETSYMTFEAENLLKDKEHTERLASIFPNSIKFMKEGYLEYTNLIKRINSF